MPRGHLGKFVEQQGPVLRPLETAFLPFECPGECPLLVAEKLALHQRFRQRRAVRRHERPIAPRAQPVDRVRHQFFSSATLAADQHGWPNVVPVFERVARFRMTSPAMHNTKWRFQIDAVKFVPSIGGAPPLYRILVSKLYLAVRYKVRLLRRGIGSQTSRGIRHSGNNLLETHMATVGLVMTGGGARGAYQAGVLKRIGEVPAVQKRGNPFPILGGASAGAINACAMAAGSDDFTLAAKMIAELWSNITPQDVFRCDFLSQAQTSFNWILELSFGGLMGGGNAEYLLDASPSRSFLARHLDCNSIRRNIRRGHVYAIGIWATNYHSGKKLPLHSGQKGASDVEPESHGDPAYEADG